jgi:hypothetical protein
MITCWNCYKYFNAIALLNHRVDWTFAWAMIPTLFVGFVPDAIGQVEVRGFGSSIGSVSEWGYWVMGV